MTECEDWRREEYEKLVAESTPSTCIGWVCHYLCCQCDCCIACCGAPDNDLTRNWATRENLKDLGCDKPASTDTGSSKFSNLRY